MSYQWRPASSLLERVKRLTKTGNPEANSYVCNNLHKTSHLPPWNINTTACWKNNVRGVMLLLVDYDLLQYASCSPESTDGRRTTDYDHIMIDVQFIGLVSNVAVVILVISCLTLRKKSQVNGITLASRIFFALDANMQKRLPCDF